MTLGSYALDSLSTLARYEDASRSLLRRRASITLKGSLTSANPVRYQPTSSGEKVYRIGPRFALFPTARGKQRGKSRAKINPFPIAEPALHFPRMTRAAVFRPTHKPRA